MNKIVTPDGEVIDSTNQPATIAKLMEAKATPPTYDPVTGEELTPKTYPDPSEVYVEVDKTEVKSHPWRKPVERSDKIAQVKAEANRRILDVAPEWKQRNMIARSVELTDKALNNVTLTAVEQTEKAALKAVWGGVKAIRVASDAIEAEIAASDDPASIDIANHVGWSNSSNSQEPN